MWPATNEHTVMFATKPITLNKYIVLHDLLQILDNIQFLDIIILKRKPCTKTRSSSPNDFMFFTSTVVPYIWQSHKSSQTIVVPSILLTLFLYNQTTWVHNIK